MGVLTAALRVTAAMIVLAVAAPAVVATPAAAQPVMKLQPPPPPLAKQYASSWEQYQAYKTAASRSRYFFL